MKEFNLLHSNTADGKKGIFKVLMVNPKDRQII